jgi:hypothetical protein
MPRRPGPEDHFAPCAVRECPRPSEHRHHVAPRSIFGELEADRWPILELCAVHHSVWHARVWPGRAKVRREIIARKTGRNA